MYKLAALVSIFYVAVTAQECGFSANVSFGMGELAPEFATAGLGFGDPALFDQDGHEIMSTRIAKVETPWTAYGCPPGPISTTEATITLGVITDRTDNICLTVRNLGTFTSNLTITRSTCLADTPMLGVPTNFVPSFNGTLLAFGRGLWVDLTEGLESFAPTNDTTAPIMYFSSV
ncbi:hypothetical protein GGX14DRAFT_451290 [Mycena pura]|uniref:Uncharacterized protein n=1 Tax=Mycena pura TaxID=153505 RepID=A0AAD6VDM7_9AGAR|nr:hypothetical protein GGX14DRAFT_451290 [Mycena pura]